MTTLTMDMSKRAKLLVYLAVGLAVLLIFALLPRASAPIDLAKQVAPNSGMNSYSADAQYSPRMEKIAAAPSASSAPASTPVSNADRLIVRKAALELIVDSPRTAIDRCLQIVQQYGGYVVSSQLGGTNERQTGTIMLRVPAAKFDAVRNDLRGIAKNVDSEQVSSDDVTMQYAENEATLRNFRAEEASYLEIMKRSGKISETLEVARQLSEVRGRIERLQAAILTMKHETEMAAISMNLRTEPVAIGKSKWRPLYELQSAWESGLESLATFATFMFGLLLQLPAILAWTVTLVFGGKLAIFLFKHLAKFFGFLKPENVVAAPQQ